MKWKPRRKMENIFKENCKKIGGETTEGPTSVTCKMEEDKEMGYSKRTIMLDKSNDSAHLVQGGSSAKIGNPVTVKVEEVADPEGFEKRAGGKAPKELVVEDVHESSVSMLGKIRR